MDIKKVEIKNEDEQRAVYFALRFLVKNQKAALKNGIIKELPLRAKLENTDLVIPQDDYVQEDLDFALSEFSKKGNFKLVSNLKKRIEEAPVITNSMQFILDDIFACEDEI